MGRKEKIYALYKGDFNIIDGTIPEIAMFTGKTIASLKYLTYQAYANKDNNTQKSNRLELVLIDD